MPTTPRIVYGLRSSLPITVWSHGPLSTVTVRTENQGEAAGSPGGGGGKAGTKASCRLDLTSKSLLCLHTGPACFPLPQPAPWQRIWAPSPPLPPCAGCRAVMTALRQMQEGPGPPGFKPLLHFSPCGENFLSQRY